MRSTACPKILLKGAPGVGKSTVVARLVDLLRGKGVPVAGFLTRELREDGRRVGFAVCDLDGTEAVIARENYTTNVQVGRYRVDVAAFERTALPALIRMLGQNQVVIIDEIGRMQLASTAFVNVLHKIMDRNMPVVATVHIFEHPVTDGLLRREDVQIVEVSEAARDDLPARLLTWLTVL